MCWIHQDNTQDCFKFFVELEFPREDNKILEYTIEELKEKIKCDFILLKILMVRLRRYSDEQDFNLFKELINKNLSTILESDEKFLNIRWIISILETFVDFGDNIESRNALIAITFHRNEKFFSTFLDFFDVSLNSNYVHNQNRYIIGMPLDDITDLPEKYFTRIKDKLTETPLIYGLFQKIIKYLVRNEETLLNILSKQGEEKNFKTPIEDLLK
jgi:hypothetical protein